MRQAAGILIISRDSGRVFLLKRSNAGKYPLVWSLLSGEMDPGDTNAYHTLVREIGEEIQINAKLIDMRYVYTEKAKALHFHYFVGFTDTEFKATLDHENVDCGWFVHDELPSPLFPGLRDKIRHIWNQ